MENARCSSSCSFMSQLMMVDFPVPLGAENMISLPLIFFYFLQRIEHLLLNLFELVLHLHHDILHLCLIRL